MSLYNCRTEGPNYRVVKFDNDLNLETIYTLRRGYSGKYYCNCFAGNRDTCRHREMLAGFIKHNVVDSKYFFDYENWRWVTPVKEIET